MKNSKEYSAKLEELKNEQIELMKGNMRLKVNRIRKQEITAEFYAIKGEWKEKAEAGELEF